MVYIPQGKKKEGSNAAFAVNVAQKRKYRFAVYLFIISRSSYFCDLQFFALFCFLNHFFICGSKMKTCLRIKTTRVILL